MAKQKTVFYCQSCGTQAPKWLGRCPSCQAWNTFVEEVSSTAAPTSGTWRGPETSKGIRLAKPRLLSEIEDQNLARIDTQDAELNRALGGGIVPGMLVLLGGEPGIGKSTLLLQIALNLGRYKVLYVSGEESDSQIKMRALRMGAPETACYILTETDTQNIFRHIEQLNPGIVIIDSIQTLHTPMLEAAAGSVSQVRECTAQFMKFAKETGTPVFLIGHITKDGTLAGPKVLEHIVDTVLQFEGDRHLTYRLLRTIKNRFGSTSELGIYEMQSGGLRQVSNPSELLLTQHEDNLSGVAIAAMLEGTRPLLVEVQSLVTPAAYGTPQRSCTGFDPKRLAMLLAVLEKRGGYRLGNQDVFLNIAGGLRVEDPAVDLAVCASILSSLQDVAIPRTICFAGEVGLGGEVRAVSRIDWRVAEAEKLGFKSIFLSEFAIKAMQGMTTTIKLAPVQQVLQMADNLMM